MTVLPTGTVTFLFTDIEGSTRLTQALGSAWPPILGRHNQLLADAIASHEGVQFGSEGDAVFATFVSAPRAVAAAAVIQRALDAEPWPEGGTIRVRIGLLTGEGSVSGGSYVGIDVHRVARIASAGHGGQVLLSATTSVLVQGSLPDGVAIRDLGEVRLKDLLRPEAVSQLVIDGLPSDFPSLRSLDAVPNNLPTQLTTFLGRDAELAEAAQLLAGARLLSLIGPGGTGKTRLALQLAADVTHDYPQGVYFVPLGTLEQASLVLPTIAQTVGLTDPAGKPLERLAGQLAAKRVLLVLDNLEQVIDAAQDVATLLERCPELRIIATSRAPLRIYGEQEYRVPPLTLPDPGQLPDPDTLSTFASVALFAERARAVRPGFAVTAENAPSIVEICFRLDGLPLAIELAAARVRILSPQAIVARLNDRLSLLAGGSRNLPERQQTLRGAIDWSHELLDEAQRLIFARISAFSGGAALDAVEEVVMGAWPADAGPAPGALEALSFLLDNSLVQERVGAEDEPRFGMLETIREYAAERLAEREPEGGTRLRHALHFLAFVEGAAGELFSPEQRTWLERLELDHDNIRAAVSVVVSTGRADLALRFLAGCWRFWQMRGYLAEAREQAERILAMPEAADHPELRLQALDAAGGIAYWQGDLRRSRTWYEEERDLARTLGNRPIEVQSLYNQAMTIATTRDDVEHGRQLAREALAGYRELGDRHGEGLALFSLVNTYIFGTDTGEAVVPADEAIAIFRETDDAFMLAWSLFTRALASAQDEDLPSARAMLSEALGIFRENNDLSGYALVLDGFATLAWREGNPDLAMRISGAAAAVQDVSGVGLAEVNRNIAGYFPRELLEQAPLAAAYEEGKRLTADQAVALALGEEMPSDQPAEPSSSSAAANDG